MNDISSIFQSIHGSLNEEELMPIDDFNSYLNKDIKIPIEEVCQALGVESKHLFYNPNNLLNSYCYWDGLFYYDFVSLYQIVEDIQDEFSPFFDIANKFKKHFDRTMDLFKKGKWSDFFFLTDKSVRFSVFEKYHHQIPIKEKKAVFLDIYSTSEYGFNELDNDLVRSVLNLDTLEEYKVPFDYETDEDGFYTIYRGEGSLSTSFDKAFSWTFNPDIAEFFATRFNSPGRVHARKVHPSHIKAFIPHSNEEEVLVFPEHLRLF